MKAYKNYMDRIDVPETLHRRILAAAEKPAARGLAFHRAAPAAACLTVLLLVAVTLPALLKSAGETAPPVTSFPADTTVQTSTAAGDRYALHLNPAAEQPSANRLDIAGHFWHELTPEQLDAVFPGLGESYTLSGTAHYIKTGELIWVDAFAATETGKTALIRLAPGEAPQDCYVLGGDAAISELQGVPIQAGYYEGEEKTVYFASFSLSGVGYYAELTGGREEKQAFPGLLGWLIAGGAPDLSVLENPVIPELREEAMELSEARGDPDFGAYLPSALPDGYAFQSAYRLVNQERNSLFVLWSRGMSDVSWRVSAFSFGDEARITSVSDKASYDLSLYPIPRADSVPEALREIVKNPVFRIEDLTLDAVRARAYTIDDAGDEPGWRMRFGVLYENVLVEISTKGLSPEKAYELLQEIGGTE